MSAVALSQPSLGTRAVLSVSDSLIVARRNLMQIVRIPAVLVFELVHVFSPFYALENGPARHDIPGT